MNRRTLHKIIYADSRNSVKENTDNQYAVTITSPPYPMIEMWDSLFSTQNDQIIQSLRRGDGDSAFELMHIELDKVWRAAFENIVQGGMACINIGDATRKIGESFRMYPNHSRILSATTRLGFHSLPEILWRKQSNKPNKFMGSGMLPAGAYVTQEHEYILLLRKGEKRSFPEAEKGDRRKSAFFWEERNIWFSDIWEDLKGDRQTLNHPEIRGRSAAYPFELAYRLVAMFSVQGDWVLDPFLGTATTTLAAMALGRNSVGFEVAPGFKIPIEARLEGFVELANRFNQARIANHIEFVRQRKEKPKHENHVYGFPVMTTQERDLEIPILKSVREVQENTYEVEYSNEPLTVIQSLL